MLAAHLLRTPRGPKRLGLGALCEFFLGTELPKEEQTSDFSGSLRDEQIKYAANDAAVLLELRGVMAPALKANNLVEIARIEFECTRAVAEIEYTGIKIDMGCWTTLTNKTKYNYEISEKKLLNYAGESVIQPDFFGTATVTSVNLNSNKQILELLHENGVQVEDTSKRSLSPYKDVPIVQNLHEFRKASKMLTGFLEPMPSFINPKTGRIHAHYGQIGAYSGRMSCGNPNMQQIPRDRDFRKCFVPATGNSMIIADYSQIELRVAAQIAHDERMIEAYRTGGDLHRLTASLVTGNAIDDITKEQRQAAKAVNFGLIFAMGARGLQAYSQDVYNVEMTIEEAEDFRERYFKAYEGIRKWHDSIKRNPPRTSRSLTGRRYFHRDDAGLAGLYNTPVQGSAADIIKNALGMLVKTLDGTGARIIAVVHDEIILEAPSENSLKAAAILKQTMEEAGKAYMPDVPLVADAQIASSWAEK
jgi:DNA polymerase-1